MPDGSRTGVNGLVFYIGLGLGLALAAGLRPFLPALLAGALASSGALGVSFAHGGYEFLQAGWWLLALTVAFVAAWALQLRLGVAPTRRRDRSARRSRACGIGIGALLFAGTLAEHGDASWPGLLGGAVPRRLVAGRGPGRWRARARSLCPTAARARR